MIDLRGQRTDRTWNGPHIVRLPGADIAISFGCDVEWAMVGLILPRGSEHAVGTIPPVSARHEFGFGELALETLVPCRARQRSGRGDPTCRRLTRSPRGVSGHNANDAWHCRLTKATEGAT